MMRCADHDNPILLEGLGDLLQHSENQISAMQLAARSYLQASYVVTDKGAARSFRNYPERVLVQQVGPRNSLGLPLKQLEQEFKAELDDPNRWYAILKKVRIGVDQEGRSCGEGV